MKTVFVFFAFVIVFATASCSSDNVKDETIDITGKWKLIEKFSDRGDGNGHWVNVSDSDSYTINFDSNGSFITNTCSGRYEIFQSSYNTLVLHCPNEVKKRSIILRDTFLIIDGTPYICDESCAEKFIKIE